MKTQLDFMFVTYRQTIEMQIEYFKHLHPQFL